MKCNNCKCELNEKENMFQEEWLVCTNRFCSMNGIKIFIDEDVIQSAVDA